MALTFCLTEKDRFIPDYMVVCNKSKIKYDGVYGAPDLEFRLVDPKNRSIKVHTLQGQEYILNKVDIWHSPDDLELLTEDEKRNLRDAVKSNVFDNLSLPLDEVFENM